MLEWSLLEAMLMVLKHSANTGCMEMRKVLSFWKLHQLEDGKWANIPKWCYASLNFPVTLWSHGFQFYANVGQFFRTANPNEVMRDEVLWNWNLTKKITMLALTQWLPFLCQSKQFMGFMTLFCKTRWKMLTIKSEHLGSVTRKYMWWYTVSPRQLVLWYSL